MPSTATPTNGAGPRIKAPQPPKGTTAEDYEFNVAIWRIRITDLLLELDGRIERYEGNESNRHQAIIDAISSQNSWWHGGWEAVKVCVSGGIDIAKAAVSNENGQLKWLALLVLGLAVISAGGALSGLGFHISTSETEAPGVEAPATTPAPVIEQVPAAPLPDQP